MSKGRKWSKVTEARITVRTSMAPMWPKGETTRNPEQAKRQPKGAKGSREGSKRVPKESQRGPTTIESEPKESQAVSNVSKRRIACSAQFFQKTTPENKNANEPR